MFGVIALRFVPTFSVKSYKKLVHSFSSGVFLKQMEMCSTKEVLCKNHQGNETVSLLLRMPYNKFHTQDYQT